MVRRLRLVFAIWVHLPSRRWPLTVSLPPSKPTSAFRVPLAILSPIASDHLNPVAAVVNTSVRYRGSMTSASFSSCRGPKSWKLDRLLWQSSTGTSVFGCGS
jgi:hypothetical protein